MFSFAKFTEFRDLFNEVGQYGAFTNVSGVDIEAEFVRYGGRPVFYVDYDPGNQIAKVYMRSTKLRTQRSLLNYKTRYANRITTEGGNTYSY